VVTVVYHTAVYFPVFTELPALLSVPCYVLVRIGIIFFSKI